MGNYIDKLNDQDGNVIYPITLTKAVYKEDTSSTLDDLLTAKLDTSAYTASDALAKIKTVDGAGSGLDADLLDGKEASAFSLNDHVHTLGNISGVTATAAEVNVLDGITASTSELNYIDGVTSNIQTQLNTKLPSTSYTASDVLTKLKTVDGTASGLDADLLDNQEGSYYLNFTNATNKPSPVITLSGDASGSATLTNMGSATLNVTVADDSHNHIISNVDGLQSALDSKTNSSLLGAANGVAQLDANGFVPASQLPSYVDDILEYNGIVNFPVTGESGKIYVDTLTNLTYRWSGSSYTEISKSLALGETSSTAYAGDKGKAVTDALASHKNNTSNPHNVTASQVGLGIFETTATNIKMNGTQGVGVLSTVARADHVHPVDTSRAPVSHTHTVSSIVDLTATAAELNYVDGVTSNIQSQLDSKYSSDNLPLYPVTSVNGKQGIVVLSASDVSAISIDDITTVLGSSTSKVPSEKAVADAISNSGGGDMSKVNYATQSDSIVDQSFKAEKDGDGNIITSTYSKNKIEINVNQPSSQNINDFWYKIL